MIFLAELAFKSDRLLGISSKFGELVGVSSRKVSAWEHGKAIPTAEQKDKICNIARDLKKIDAQ